jgi:hypothetical protein
LSRVIPALAITHESAVTAYLIAAIRVVASLLNHVSRDKSVIHWLTVAPISVSFAYTTQCSAWYHERHCQSRKPLLQGVHFLPSGPESRCENLRLRRRPSRKGPSGPNRYGKGQKNLSLACLLTRPHRAFWETLEFPKRSAAARDRRDTRGRMWYESASRRSTHVLPATKHRA